jgi:hypothetical protein
MSYDISITPFRDIAVFHRNGENTPVSSSADDVTTNKSTQLFGLCGFIGSGKNTAGDVLLNLTEGMTQSFAGPLKDAVSVIFGWDRTRLEGIGEKDREWRETPDPYWSEAFGRDVTPRLVLQEMGTDVCREWLPDIWVRAAGRRHSPPEASVFTDVRFGNEMEWIVDQGGTIIWVYRANNTGLTPEDAHQVATKVSHNVRLTPFTFYSAVHASETSFLSQGADLIHVVIKNVGIVDDLKATTSHIHRLLSRNEQRHMPWGQTTIYVTREDAGAGWSWIYRDPGTDEQQGRAYNKHHEYVSEMR